jgi:tRNA C32,U32 (ribose-2'-O)-methylase TrmJ
MVMLFVLSWDRGTIQEAPLLRALNKKEVENTISHFEEALKILGYKKGGANLRPRILQTLRGLIKRGGLLEPEAQMIKGLSRKIREKVGSSR